MNKSTGIQKALKNEFPRVAQKPQHIKHRFTIQIWKLEHKLSEIYVKKESM